MDKKKYVSKSILSKQFCSGTGSFHSLETPLGMGEGIGGKGRMAQGLR